MKSIARKFGVPALVVFLGLINPRVCRGEFYKCNGVYQSVPCDQRGIASPVPLQTSATAPTPEVTPTEAIQRVPVVVDESVPGYYILRHRSEYVLANVPVVETPDTFGLNGAPFFTFKGKQVDVSSALSFQPDRGLRFSTSEDTAVQGNALKDKNIYFKEPPKNFVISVRVSPGSAAVESLTSCLFIHYRDEAGKALFTHHTCVNRRLSAMTLGSKKPCLLSDRISIGEEVARRVRSYELVYYETDGDFGKLKER